MTYSEDVKRSSNSNTDYTKYLEFRVEALEKRVEALENNVESLENKVEFLESQLDVMKLVLIEKNSL